MSVKGHLAYTVYVRISDFLAADKKPIKIYKTALAVHFKSVAFDLEIKLEKKLIGGSGEQSSIRQTEICNKIKKTHMYSITKGDAQKHYSSGSRVCY